MVKIVFVYTRESYFFPCQSRWKYGDWPGRMKSVSRSDSTSKFRLRSPEETSRCRRSRRRYRDTSGDRTRNTCSPSWEWQSCCCPSCCPGEVERVGARTQRRWKSLDTGLTVSQPYSFTDLQLPKLTTAQPYSCPTLQLNSLTAAQTYSFPTDDRNKDGQAHSCTVVQLLVLILN